MSDSEGGVIYAEDSNFKVSNCDIYNNFSDIKGGAIFATNSTLALWNCNIAANKCNNTKSTYGGALHFVQSVAQIDNCKIVNNFASERGGGVYSENSDLKINSCRIFNNISGEGAGLSLDESELTIDNSEIVFNSSILGYGGGILSTDGYKFELYNTTIAKNYAIGNGGGLFIHNNDDEIKIYNSIIFENTINSTIPNDFETNGIIPKCVFANTCISNHIVSSVPQEFINCVRNNPEFRGVSEDDLSGTIEFERLSRVVKGVDSHFTDELQVDDSIYLVADGENYVLCVKEIISDTKLLLVSLYLGDARYPDVAKVQKNRIDLQRKSDGDAADSPCIDSGNNQYVNSSVDLLDKKRIVDGDSDSQAIVDMGARELQ